MAEKWELDLAKLAWEARTPGDAEALVKELDTRFGSKAIPVGRPNNIGTIRMASDPGLALVERVTNGIDSLIEREVLLNGTCPNTPEAAAHLHFGVPVSGLGDMLEKERRSVAEQLVLSMHDSGTERRPTVRITDKGMGQHPDDFNHTLLSLNESNKVGKPYTMGTYGQGGSVTFGFSDWTIVISRRHPQLLQPGQSDMVGLTVVYEEQTDPSLAMLPRYVWLVSPSGSPFALSPECFPGFDHGARITHVGYDVQSLRGPFTTQLWQFMHATLFDPVLPFLVAGDRTETERKAKDRVIIGNAARLDNVDKAKGDIELAAHDIHQIDLGPEYGQVNVSWWALTRPSSSSSTADAAGGYVQANNAVSLTLHGQRQDAVPRTWIKDRALLPHLYKNMVVNINANGLSPIGRRELFASTRERATESELRRIIYDEVADLLRTDAELKRLNHEEKEKLLQRSTAASNEKVRKRLGKFIKTKLKNTFKPGTNGTGIGAGGAAGGSGTNGGGSQPGKKKTNGGGSSQPRNTDDTHLPHVPTAIAFESQKVRLASGFKSYLWVDIDAKNGYLPAHDDDLNITITGAGDKAPRVKSRSQLMGGKSRWAIEADDGTQLGIFELNAELMTANGLLEADIEIEVVTPPVPNTSGPGGKEEETGPDVRWVFKADWKDHGDMDAKTVGYVTEDDEETIIWVNRHFELLDTALSNSKLTADAVETRATRYQFPVACGLWLQQHEVKSANPKPDDAYQRAELHRLAEAVLVAMDPDVELAGVESED